VPECFFAHLGDCQGRLVKAHLVPKGRIAKELRSAGAGELEIRDAIWDPRCWRPMCGGSSGLGGHHGQYDAKQIHLDEWPQDFVEFLVEHEIHWMTEAYAR
jgi:hypothetical protein